MPLPARRCTHNSAEWCIKLEYKLSVLNGIGLRVCSDEAGSTFSAIGRELGITRRDASKVVSDLSDRGYVRVANSTTSKREKSVVLTPLGVD